MCRYPNHACFVGIQRNRSKVHRLKSQTKKLPFGLSSIAYDTVELRLMLVLMCEFSQSKICGGISGIGIRLPCSHSIVRDHGDHGFVHTKCMVTVQSFSRVPHVTRRHVSLALPGPVGPSRGFVRAGPWRFTFQISKRTEDKLSDPSRTKVLVDFHDHINVETTRSSGGLCVHLQCASLKPCKAMQMEGNATRAEQ